VAARGARAAGQPHSTHRRIAARDRSSDEAGQIYVPTANWLLMAGTLLVVVLFETSESLAGLFSCVP
jgi:K+ transporter